MMCLPTCRSARAGLALAVVLAAPCALAAPPTGEGGGTVAEIIDGATLRLDDGGVVRLVGIDAPEPPPGRSSRGRWPHEAEARAALEAFALGKRVILLQDGTREDRHGRRLAHVHVVGAGGEEDLWLQGEMLKRGLARVHLAEDNRALAAEMLAIERAARAARRGLWAERIYRVRTPEEAAADADSFQLVEGTVYAAAIVSGRGYLNYGPDRHTDFTVVLSPRVRRLMRDAGVDMNMLAGRRIRVRGWIMLRDGPMIELTCPEAIELMEE
ncbi:MAG TPA: thermonuclease family protein [Alphaproteobacteria bacterium]